MKGCIGNRVENSPLMSKLGRGGFVGVYLGEYIHLRTQAGVLEGEEGAIAAR